MFLNQTSVVRCHQDIEWTTIDSIWREWTQFDDQEDWNSWDVEQVPKSGQNKYKQVIRNRPISFGRRSVEIAMKKVIKLINQRHAFE